MVTWPYIFLAVQHKKFFKLKLVINLFYIILVERMGKDKLFLVRVEWESVRYVKSVLENNIICSSSLKIYQCKPDCNVVNQNPLSKMLSLGN